MSDAEKEYILCPGTFSFCLFYGSTKQLPEFLKALFEIIDPLKFDPNDKYKYKTTYQNACSNFYLCKSIGIGYDLLDDIVTIETIENNFEKQYETYLTKTKEFVDKFFNGNDYKKENAIRAILALIQLDNTIKDDAEFFIKNGSDPVIKAALSIPETDQYAEFILGVWFFAIQRKDATGKLLRNNAHKTIEAISYKDDKDRRYSLNTGFLKECNLYIEEPDNDDMTQTSSSSYKDNSHRQILYQAETIIDPNDPEKLMTLAEFANKNNINLTKSSHWRNLTYNPNIKYQNLNSDSAEFNFKIGEVCSIKTKCSFSSVYVNDEHSISVGIQLGHQEWVGRLPFEVGTNDNKDNTENASGWTSQYARNWTVLKDAELEILFQVVNPILHTIHILIITTCSRKDMPTAISSPSGYDLSLQNMYKNGAEIGKILRQSKYPLFWDKRKPIDKQKLKLLLFPDGKLTKTTLDLITESVFLLFEHLDEEQSALFRCGLFAEGGCIAETVLLNMAHLDPSFRSGSLYQLQFTFNPPDFDRKDVKWCIDLWTKHSDNFEYACPLQFRCFDEYNNSPEWSNLRNENKYYLDRLYISNAFAFGGCKDKKSILFYYMGKSSYDDKRRYSAYGFIQKSINLGLEKESEPFYENAIIMLNYITRWEGWSADKQRQIDDDLYIRDEFHELLWILDEYDWLK